MPFETYKPSLDKILVATLSKNHITLSSELTEKMNAKYVELAYNKGTQTIRIKPSTKNQQGLVVTNNRIGTRGFFRFFNINIKGKFHAAYDHTDLCLYIKI